MQTLQGTASQAPRISWVGRDAQGSWGPTPGPALCPRVVLQCLQMLPFRLCCKFQSCLSWSINSLYSWAVICVRDVWLVCPGLKHLQPPLLFVCQCWHCLEEVLAPRNHLWWTWFLSWALRYKLLAWLVCFLPRGALPRQALLHPPGLWPNPNCTVVQNLSPSSSLSVLGARNPGDVPGHRLQYLLCTVSAFVCQVTPRLFLILWKWKNIS